MGLILTFNQSATIPVSTPSPATVNLSSGLPGPKGSTGTAATITAGATSTLAPGSAATVTNSGTSSAAVFNFGIPQGMQGVPGTAATINAGTVTTLPYGSIPTVTNSGTQYAAVFNFGIPQGPQGVPGTNGTNGVGLPIGGLTGQTPVKTSNADYAIAWVNSVASVAGRTGAVTLSTTDISGMASYLLSSTAALTYYPLSSNPAGYATTSYVSSGYVPKSASDGNYYVQQNGSWVQLIVS